VSLSVRVLIRTQLFFQFCTLGRLSHEVGWKYQDVVETLEAKRRVKALTYYKKKMAVSKVKQTVCKDAKVIKRIAPYQKIIESYGYA
jgi:large subunit ribosomal protein L13Ae